MLFRSRSTTTNLPPPRRLQVPRTPPPPPPPFPSTDIRQLQLFPSPIIPTFSSTSLVPTPPSQSSLLPPPTSSKAVIRTSRSVSTASRATTPSLIAGTARRRALDRQAPNQAAAVARVVSSTLIPPTPPLRTLGGGKMGARGAQGASASRSSRTTWDGRREGRTARTRSIRRIRGDRGHAAPRRAGTVVGGRGRVGDGARRASRREGRTRSSWEGVAQQALVRGSSSTRGGTTPSSLRRAEDLRGKALWRATRGASLDRSCRSRPRLRARRRSRLRVLDRGEGRENPTRL